MGKIKLEEALNKFDHDMNEIITQINNLPDEAEEVKRGIPVFRQLFIKYIQEREKAIEWEKVHPMHEEQFFKYDNLESVDEAEASELFNKIVVVRLNGGLGTSMGCEGPKSALVVRDDHTFLDLSIEQISYLNSKYSCDIPFVLMNSFYTDEETKKNLSKYTTSNVHFYSFCQNRCPRIEKQYLRPIIDKQSVMSNYKWYPPGHGDFYQSFYASGLLDKFIEQGKEYVFVSNIDNLGATVESSIIKYIRDKKLEFMMELTPKVLSDVKGGTLVNYDGHTRLLELTQVPEAYTKTFKNVNKFPFFNTNNIWLNLKAIKEAVIANKLNVEIIVNPKAVNDKLEIIQLETAIGAAIKCFNKNRGLIVPRKRFLPVKKSQDLLVIMSNLYEVHHGTLLMSSNRLFQSTPVVKLGSLFDKVTNFRSRFKNIPDMMDLHHLTVSGNVFFGSNVTMKGTVIIIADEGNSITIPNNAVLEDHIVSGSLKILDH